MRRFICTLLPVLAFGVLAWSVGIAPPAAAAYRAVDDGIEFSYTDPSASSVALAGDFNEWSTSATPLSDEDGDGIWTVVIALPAGSHEYKFVVNGGTWVADPDNPLTGGDFGNSLINVGADGKAAAPGAAAKPSLPSGTPSVSNTPLHSKVYMGGFFRMLMKSRTKADGDTRLRVQRPEDQFNLDVTANLNQKVWGTLRLQVRTGAGGANELTTDLYKAQSNFEEDNFQVKAFYNDEVFNSDEPLELLGHIDLRGTITEEHRPFGQGLQGAILRMQPFGGQLEILYADTYDRDIFNRSEPTIADPRKDGLNQNTGTDVVFGRWSRQVGSSLFGFSYRGEFSDWWVNFTKQENPYPTEVSDHRDAQVRPNDDDKSDNFELANDRQFGAIDLTLPLPEDLTLQASGGYGWYSARWDLGNREDVQGQGFVNGKVDLPIGNQQFYRTKVVLSGDRSGLRARASHEINYELGMDAGENQIVYRTQPGSTIEDRDRFVVQDIRQIYQDVNGVDALDVLRLGPAPQALTHRTEIDLSYDWHDWTVDLEFDRIRDNLNFVDFSGNGPATLNRWRWRTSPRLHWKPFQKERYHLSLLSEFLRTNNPSVFDAVGAANTQPALPAQGYGSFVGMESNEIIFQGLVPAERFLGASLDLRFDLRFISYNGPDNLSDSNGQPLDLDRDFVAYYAALVYRPIERVHVEVGVGVDPTFYDVITPEGWGNGRQQFRDDYLVQQRLDPYNPINVLDAEQELEDRVQLSINALITF